MTPERQKLTDRVMKLLALAAGTNFDAEADTARRLADELMAKHNISPGENAKDRDKLVSERIDPHFTGAVWEFMLAAAAAKLCGCGCYYYGEYAWFTIVGTVANVEACVYIIRKLNEQRIREWLAYKRSGSDSFHKFSYGFSQGIESKINLLIVPALMQARKAAKLWYEATHKIEIVNGKYGRASSSAGLKAGGGASLHRGEVGGRVPQKLLP